MTKFDRLYRTRDGRTLFAVIVDAPGRQAFIRQWHAHLTVAQDLRVFTWPAPNVPDTVLTNDGAMDDYERTRDDTISLAQRTAAALARHPDADPMMVVPLDRDAELRARAERDQDAKIGRR